MSDSPAPEPLPLILITGACGFVGQRVVEALKKQYRIIALDWRPPNPRRGPRHPNVRWLQADIADRDTLLRLARGDGNDEAPQLLLHLAAHYEFEQRDEAPYWRANVQGLRNVLDAAVEAKIPRFVFASSLAACSFPAPGQALTEASPPDGDHIYARTKRVGELMLKEYSGRLKSAIVRFAAMYSDYCEYPPLYKFLETWLSNAWNQRMLGGRGASAIPFLHVRDATHLLRTVIRNFDRLEDGEVLIASPDGCTSHTELFEAATAAYYGAPVRPLCIPRPLVRPGIYARVLMGGITGKMPFERPWMADYVDLEMRVDASQTRARLGWAPRPRLAILNRLPMLVENLRSDPGAWLHKNEGALHKAALRPNLLVHALIQRHHEEIGRRLSEALVRPSQDLKSYQDLGEREQAWNHRMVLSQLSHSVRTRERKVFVDYCADLAARRFEQGFKAEELRAALVAVEQVVLEVLRADPDAAAVEGSLHEDLSVTMRFAIDEVEEVFDELKAQGDLCGRPFGCEAPKQEGADEHRAVAEGGQAHHEPRGAERE